MLGSYQVATVIRDEYLAAQLRRAEELQMHFHAQAEQFRRWQSAYHQHMRVYYTRKIDYHERMTSLYKSQLLESASPYEVLEPPPASPLALPQLDRRAMTLVIDADDEDITDAQWALVAPLLPLGNGRGRPYIDDRRTLNGVLYVTTHDIGWNHMPARFGSYVTCWRRYLRWQAKGIWGQVAHLLDLDAGDATSDNGQDKRAVAVGGMGNAERWADLTP